MKFIILPAMVLTGIALGGCQSEEQKTQAYRERMLSACLPRAATMDGVDAEQFCNCVADRTMAGRSASELSAAPAPDTAQIGDQCAALARGPFAV